MGTLYDTVEKTIPTSQGAFWRCTINGVTYEYKAGETVDVPDFVGAIIDNELRQRPTYDDPTVRMTTQISEASTDKEVPSAKAVYDASRVMYVDITRDASTSELTSNVSIEDVYNAIMDGRIVCARRDDVHRIYHLNCCYLYEGSPLISFSYTAPIASAGYAETEKIVAQNGVWTSKSVTFYKKT